MNHTVVISKQGKGGESGIFSPTGNHLQVASTGSWNCHYQRQRQEVLEKSAPSRVVVV